MLFFEKYSPGKTTVSLLCSIQWLESLQVTPHEASAQCHSPHCAPSWKDDQNFSISGAHDDPVT